jgi:hypothetical protein
VSVPLAEFPGDAIIGAGAVFFRWPIAKLALASIRRIKTDLMICLLPHMIGSVHFRRNQLSSGVIFIGNHFQGLNVQIIFDEC